MLKKIIAVALLASIAVTPINAIAANQTTVRDSNPAYGEIQPRYNALADAYLDLVLSNGKATCEVYMSGSSQINITAKVTLYKVSSSGAKERIRYWPSLTSKVGILDWVSPSVSITSGNYLMVVSATATGPYGSDTIYEEIEGSY